MQFETNKILQEMDSKKKNSKQKVGKESQENLEVLENVAENLMVG